MNSRWNQWVNKHLQTTYGKTDTEELITIINLLRQAFPKNRYHRDWFLMFDRLTGRYFKHAESVTYQEATTYKILRPDILVTRPGMMKIFEIDGPIHDKKTEITAKKIETYENAGLNFTIANKADLKSQNKDLIVYLLEALEPF